LTEIFNIKLVKTFCLWFYDSNLQSKFILYILCRVKKNIFKIFLTILSLIQTNSKRGGGGEIFEKEITKSFPQREQQSGRAPLVSKRHPLRTHNEFSHISKSTSWRIPARYHLNQYVRLIANAAPIIPISALNIRAQ